MMFLTVLTPCLFCHRLPSYLLSQRYYYITTSSIGMCNKSFINIFPYNPFKNQDNKVARALVREKSIKMSSALNKEIINGINGIIMLSA